MDMEKFSNLLVELQDILKELVVQEICRMPDEEIKKIKEKYGNAKKGGISQNVAR